ncbi:uncharacterized protein LOC135712866 [Ochlerotatus camptorhynchus]|uniref:uncharacterized protein LOC135712866 n=1 Tax=Ochlerotatus camptorhynchus TaxID=644619 RepID=UPI0031D50126
MFPQLLLLCLYLKFSSAAYYSVQSPYTNAPGINYAGGQSHYQTGYLAGPARYSGSVQPVVNVAGQGHYQTGYLPGQVRYSGAVQPVVNVVGNAAGQGHYQTGYIPGQVRYSGAVQPVVNVVGNVAGQGHYQTGYYAGPARYPGPVQPVHLVGNPSYPSYYSYNIQAPVSFATHPFQTYGHAAVTPVVYGTVQRPNVVAYAPQPVQPVVTQYHTPAIQPVHVPAAPAVPVHVPVAVTPVTPIASVTPVTTTVTKTITREEETVSSSTEPPVPVIKSRRYKVRRPAIQNQFYDIEERVIIRPVGSALVELEQPASRTETKVTTHTVQSQSDRGSSGRGRTVTTETATVTPKPQIIHTVYHQTPVQHTPAIAPHPVIIHASSAGHVVPQAVVPHFQAPVYVNHVQPVYIPATSVPVTTFKPTYHVTVPVVATPAPTTVSSTTTSTGYDYDDSVVVEARGGSGTFHGITSTEAPFEHSTLDATAKYRDDELPKRGDIAITYASTEATHQSLSEDQQTATDLTVTARSNLNSRFNVENQNQSQSIVSQSQESSQSRNAKINEITATSPRVLISNGLSAEQARSNQEQFIRLLSERDSIAEVGYGPNTDTSSSLINTYVRSRVLSATPAPQGSKETSRTVNIRRIIVSRPIETEQEVEVREQTFSPHSTAHQVTSSSDQVPVYSTIKPPAFSHDDAK